MRDLTAALVLFATATIGCGNGYRYAFLTGLAPSEQRVAETRHLAIWGHVGAGPFDLERACPAGVAEFGSYVPVGNWLPAFLTFGLYTPRTVYAVCASPAVGVSQ